jgi:hypothetical protein
MCEQALATLVRKKWPYSWCVKSSKDKISVNTAISSFPQMCRERSGGFWNRQFQCQIFKNYFWPQQVQWKCNTFKRTLTDLLPISEMIDHLDAEEGYLGRRASVKYWSTWDLKQVKTEISIYSTLACGQTEVENKESECVKWHEDWWTPEIRNAKDSQNERVMRKGINGETMHT